MAIFVILGGFIIIAGFVIWVTIGNFVVAFKQSPRVITSSVQYLAILYFLIIDDLALFTRL